MTYFAIENNKKFHYDLITLREFPHLLSLSIFD